MSISITDSSFYAMQYLPADHIVTVHSVYRNTINVLNGSQLLALQTANTVVSPISLITQASTEEFRALPVKAGAAIRLDSYFSFANVTCHDCHMQTKLSSYARNFCEKSIRDILASSEKGGFDQFFPDWNLTPDSTLPFHLIPARQKIQKAFDGILSGDFTASIETLVSLIGYGTGLTPSGDDFLCGLLAGLILTGTNQTVFAQALRQNIQNNLHRTVDISQAFLKCALQQQFSLPVFALTSMSEETSTEQITTLFQEIGHSSGMDTLCGIYYAFQIISALSLRHHP